MSIVCTEVKMPKGSRPLTNKFDLRFVRATIDPKTYDQFPFPSDYKFLSCVLPRKYADWAERIQNFKVRPDDTFVISFPKSGTTWMQNIVHCLKNDLDLNADFVAPSFNYLEYPILYERVAGDNEFNEIIDRIDKSIDNLDVSPSPRLIKSHLPAQLLPKDVWTMKTKLIYISRDIKDVAISWYHMDRNELYEYSGTNFEYFQTFRNNIVPFAPFYEHIKSYHQLRDYENLFYITYEQLSSDPFKYVKKVSEFLGYSYNDVQLQQLVEHVSFGKMKDKIHLNKRSKDPNYRFCRKGKVGGYKDEMNDEDIWLFNQYTAEQKSKLELFD